MSTFIKTKIKVALGIFAVVALSAASAQAYTFTYPPRLQQGSTGTAVMELQKVLNMSADTQVAATGVGSAGMETSTFGPMTKAAVMKFQMKKGLAQVGSVGPATAAALNAAQTGVTPGNLPAGCTSTVGYSPTTGAACNGTVVAGPTGPLSGTVGSLDYALTSGISNEEVGEDQNDVKVAGLEVDAEDSDSDVSITAIKLNFDRGTAAASTDFEDVADEVTVWLDGTKVATIAADEFNDDNDEEKTVALTGAVVRKDAQADLYVAVSGVNNLDSGDIGDTWTVDYTLVRFVDAQGASTSEDPTVAVRTFSFESFATANDVELKVELNSDEDAINEAHVINVDATDDTDDVALLAFTLEADGDSDVNVQEVPVLITVTGAANVDDMITSVDLYHGTEKVDSQNIPTTAGATEVITFEDLDITIDAGDTEEFWVKANFISIADALDDGDTIKVELDATRVDLIDAEDESGESLDTADLTGTALGEASEARDIGIMVKLVSTSATKTAGDPAVPTTDSGTFAITFDVTAFDGDVYVDKTAPDASGGATESDLDITGTGTVLATISSSTGATEGTDGFLVEEDQTERFTITTNISAVTDGFFKVKLGSILYALTDVDGTTVYTFDLEDYKTADIFLDDQA